MTIIFNEKLCEFQVRDFFDQSIVNFVIIIKNKACNVGIIDDEITNDIDYYFGEVNS